MPGKILVTGATGFLGRHIVQKLLHHSFPVRVLVRSLASAQEYWGNQVEYAEGDVLDICSLETAMDGIDIVVHAAAVVSFWKPKTPEMMAVNIEGTANLVNVALAYPVSRFIHVSSIATFGRTSATGTISETTKWVESPENSPYAISKYKAELEVYRGIEEGLPAVILNPGVILGAGNWNQGTPGFFRMVYEGLNLYPSGTNGFVTTDDVANAVLLSVHGAGHISSRYILVNASLSYQDLLGRIARSLGKNPPGIKASAWMAAVYGQIKEWAAALSGKEPIVTRASARVSGGTYRYDGSLASRELGLEYVDLDGFIQETATKLMKSYAGRDKR